MNDVPAPQRRRFLTTQWSVVLAASGEDSGAARGALADLCASYWFPLYAFARRSGSSEHDAQDAVQSFFATLLEKGWLAAADRERGRFRTFLLTAFRHHASNERAKAAAQKRGGDRTHLALDFADGERRYGLEPADDRTPEREYERRWGLTLLGNAVARVETEFAEAGKERVFAALRPFLAAGTLQPSYEDAAEQAGLTLSATRSAIHRLRASYRAALREEIARTVPDASAVDDEIRHLMDAVAG